MTIKVNSWDDFVGQEKLKTRLDVHMRAALLENRPLEHLLLTGPLGSGKTTLAELIADTLGDPLTVLTFPMPKKILTDTLGRFTGGILFLDEVHALSDKDQEILLPVVGRGMYMGPITGNEYPLGFLTVIAATTERNKVINTLQSRFPIRPEFEDYTDGQMGLIVYNMALRSEVEMSEETAVELGRACGGIPRNAEQFIYAARALMAGDTHVASAGEILNFCGVDPDGLGELHRRYLAFLFDQNGRAGQKTIEGHLGLPGEGCREVERLLLLKKFITYSPSGRILTETGKNRASSAIRYEGRR